MASVTARRVGRGRKHKDRDWGGSAPAPVYIPDPVAIPQKNESLDRRIRNLEALGNGVFLGNVLASYLALPGLVGFWPMSSVQRSTGVAYDLSGQGRHMNYNGNPAYTYHNGLVPYLDMDGTGDYLSLADSTDLDITGIESIYTTGAAGLTMGGWFWTNATGSNQAFIGKYNSDGWVLNVNTSNVVTMTADGDSKSHSVTLATGTWYFFVGRFVPSTSVDIWINTAKESETSGIAASLANNAHTFLIGALNAGTAQLLYGRAAMCFLCANALGDDLISSLFQSSRVLMGI